MSAAQAQFSGACCFPNQTCTVLSPYECMKQGGDYLGNEVTCPTLDHCGKYDFGIGMSQVAARRLIREGVVHTILVNDAEAMYGSPHPLWDLLALGVVIAPEINVNVISAGFEDPEMSATDSAEFIAALVLSRAADAMEVFETVHPGKPFYWTM